MSVLQVRKGNAQLEGAEPVELQLWISAPRYWGLPLLGEPPGLLVSWEQLGAQGSVGLLETEGLREP